MTIGVPGRPSLYDPAYCDAVIAHMADGANVTSFAAEIGVCRATINVWMGEHPEFLEAVSRAKAKCAAWWGKAHRKSAVDNSGNATLIVFGLKNMDPDEFSDTFKSEEKSERIIRHAYDDGPPIEHDA